MLYSEKFATLQAECKGGREIAALREAVANLKKGRKDKEVEKSVQVGSNPVLVASTQTDRHLRKCAGTDRGGK